MNNKTIKNRPIAIMLTLSLCISAVGSVLYTQPVFGTTAGATSDSELPYAQDEVVVVFEDKVSQKQAEKVAEDVDAEETQLLSTPSGADTAGVVTLSEDQTVEEAIQELEDNGEVAYAQPNYRYKLDEQTTEVNSAQERATNDSYFEKLWHLDTINAEKAWELLAQKKNSKVKVAVLDTGVNPNHEDLQVNLNKSLSVDVTTSPYAKLTQDNDGHGTHVAGTIGATSNNGKGVAGVAAGEDNSIVDIIAVKVFKPGFDPVEGFGNYAESADIVKGISYAAKSGAKVINMSLGFVFEGGVADSFLKSGVDGAVNKGITVVAASGNDGNTKENHPADFDSCISVISTGPTFKRSSFSNYGAAKDISAPGESIYSALRTTNSSYGVKSGTSMATPVVSGVAAMLYYVKPSLTVNQVKNILYSTANDLYTTGWDQYSGYGNVDAYRAVGKLEGLTFVSSVKLSTTSTTLKKGQTKGLAATVAPSGASDKRVTWKSSNTKVATVTSTGKVTAKGSGTATITAVPRDGSKVSGTCKVIVPYTISYKTNGGANSKSNLTSYYNQTVTLKSPSRTGYQFKGWYTSSSYKTRVSTIKKGTKKNYTLYAKWQKVSVGKTAIRKISKLGSTTLKTYYQPISGAKGYQISYATSSSFKSKQTSTSPITVKTLKNLKAGKKYYVKVRAYTTDSAGKTVYGPYSTVKSK